MLRFSSSTTRRGCLAGLVLGAVACTSTADSDSPTATSAACSQGAVSRTVVVTGEEPGGRAGLEVDVADLDGNGCAELVVSAPWAQGAYPSGNHSGVYVLEQPDADGVLPDLARTSWSGGTGFEGWGEPMRALPDLGLVAFGGYAGDPDRPFHLFDGTAIGDVPQSATVAELHAPASSTLYSAARAASPCVGPSGAPALCVSTNDPGSPTSPEGHILLYDASLLVGDVPVETYTSRMFDGPGDAFDRPSQVGDLDGDGVADLIVGSSYGQVAVVTQVVSGDAAIRDVAAAVVEGGPDGFGWSVSVGDLDGDGHADLVVGARHAGEILAFRGPSFGADAATADWVVTDTEGLREFGDSVAVADLASDGTTEIAVGAPDDAYRGAVLLFSDLPVGNHDDTSATATLHSGLQEADDFGLALDVGDIDGDGAIDLAVGAPAADFVGVDSGAVYLFYGASGAI